MKKKKILILRFSSIGDIVLTTPVARCVKLQVPGAELHYVTKEAFKDCLIHNPHIDKLLTFKKDITELYEVLRSEKYDVVLDLHKNLRSFRLKQFLKVKSFSFNKINLQKFVAVNFKMLNALPAKHIVDRYFEAVEQLNVKNDEGGLDYFLSGEDKVNANGISPEHFPEKYAALVVGGSYYTKRIPLVKLEELCARIKMPVVCLGDKNDKNIAEILSEKFPHVLNACGQYSINQSAYIIKMSEVVITSDTGLMHIAAAFKKKIISLWGNTIPEFGMGPYKPHPDSLIMEVKNLSCRPCSKLGYKQCPKGHFKCMLDIDVSSIKIS